MRNVVVGGVDEDDLALSNVVASYEAPELGMGDWDAGMADQLSLEGTAWLKEATEQLQQQDAEFSTAMLQELLTHTALVRFELAVWSCFVDHIALLTRLQVARW